MTASTKQIVADLEELLSLKKDIDEVGIELTSIGSERDIDLSASPEVANAYADFSDEWDKKRDSIADSLESISRALQLIHDTYKETDEEIAAELNKE